MSLLDRVPQEKPAKFPKPKAAQGGDEFDDLLDAEKAKWEPPEANLIPRMENMLHLSATDKHPRTNVEKEDNFLQIRRERIKRILMQFGEPGYVDSINNLLKIFDDVDNIEAEGETVLRKLGTYGVEAGQLIGWIAACRYLIGMDKKVGLLQIRLDEIYYGNYEKAMKSVIEMQLGISLGVDKKTGEEKRIAPSSLSTSDKLIESWIQTNVPEYNELRKDIVVVATVCETLDLVLKQINQSAMNMSNILRQYPAPMLGTK